MKIALTSDLHRAFNENTWEILDAFFEELAREEWDVLILAGDLGSHRFDHFKDLLKQVNHHIVGRPVLAVRGNHDLWNRAYSMSLWADENNEITKLFRLLRHGSEYFKKHNIDHLEEGIWMCDNVAIVGWDGWYHNPNPPTNDDKRIHGGRDVHTFLNKRADHQFMNVLKRLDSVPEGFKKVVVTHMAPFAHEEIYPEFNANPKMMDLLVEKNINVLCYGHTHKAFDQVVQGIRCINSGSDYNKPKRVIFEV